jgi:hypothetical protein
VNKLQKTGALASIVLGILFLGYLVLLAVVLPAQGLGPGTLNNPATGIPFVAASALPLAIDAIYIGIAVTFLLLTLALFDRLRSAAPALMQISVVTGGLASGLFLLYAMINLVGNPIAVDMYQHDSAAGGVIYVTLRATANAFNAGALFTAGWALLLAGWAGRATNVLPNVLGYLMVGAGLAMIVSFVLLPVGLLGVLLAPVWSIWLGITLLRGRTVIRSAANEFAADNQSRLKPTNP